VSPDQPGVADPMSVETLSSAEVRTAVSAVERAHQRVSQEIPANRNDPDDPEYWQALLERNAAEVLDALEHVSLAAGYAVRYRFYERQDNEVRVRPFVARATTDVDAVRAALDWHPAPDSGTAIDRLRVNRDVDLLYRHFDFTDSAVGVFQYWLAVQEVWASASWVHTRVIADREHFGEIVARGDWQVEHSVETHQPVVVRRDGGAHLAMLLYSPLHRHSIALQRIEVQEDGSVVFADPITVASGPRGYVA
jgi:hypothetical protein